MLIRSRPRLPFSHNTAKPAKKNKVRLRHNRGVRFSAQRRKPNIGIQHPPPGRARFVGSAQTSEEKRASARETESPQTGVNSALWARPGKSPSDGLVPSLPREGRKKIGATRSLLSAFCGTRDKGPPSETENELFSFGLPLFLARIQRPTNAASRTRALIQTRCTLRAGCGRLRAWADLGRRGEINGVNRFRLSRWATPPPRKGESDCCPQACRAERGLLSRAAFSRVPLRR